MVLPVFPAVPRRAGTWEVYASEPVASVPVFPAVPKQVGTWEVYVSDPVVSVPVEWLGSHPKGAVAVDFETYPKGGTTCIRGVGLAMVVEPKVIQAVYCDYPNMGVLREVLDGRWLVAHKAPYDVGILHGGTGCRTKVLDSMLLPWMHNVRDIPAGYGLKVILKRDYKYRHTTYDEAVATPGRGWSPEVIESFLDGFVYAAEDDADTMRKKLRQYLHGKCTSVAGTMETVSLERVAPYCAMDAAGCLLIAQEHWTAFTAKEREWYSAVEWPHSVVVNRMEEKHDLMIDKQVLYADATANRNGMATLEAEWRETLPGVPIGSDDKVRRWLYGVMGRPEGLELTPTGRLKLDARAVKLIAGRLVEGSPEFRALALRGQYKTLSSRESGFYAHLEKFVKGYAEQYVRAHIRLNVVGARTGRLSSSDPNLQNVPAEVRRVYTAPPGRKIVEWDVNNFEALVMYHLSGDAVLGGILERGVSIHDHNMVVWDVEKKQAKPVWFAKQYGGGVGAIARGLGFSLEKGEGGRLVVPDLVDELNKQWAETYKGIAQFQRDSFRAAKRTGYVECISGRRRYFPNAASKDWKKQSRARRQACNSPIQGSAADVFKVMVLAVAKHARLKALDFCMCTQVHDSLVGTAPTENAEEVRQLGCTIMANAFPLCLPIGITGKVGDNWFETK